MIPSQASKRISFAENGNCNNSAARKAVINNDNKWNVSRECIANGSFVFLKAAIANVTFVTIERISNYPGDVENYVGFDAFHLGKQQRSRITIN